MTLYKEKIPDLYRTLAFSINVSPWIQKF